MPDKTGHWNDAYAIRGAEAVSWSDPGASESLALVMALLHPGEAVVDVGGGASDLARQLVGAGFGPVTVLDLSDAALALAAERAGDAARDIAWLQGDVTGWTPPRRYSVLHDRAAFHFLTTPADRAAYVRTLLAALAPGGHAILSTFAEDGPDRCSGLPVARYAPGDLTRTLDALAPGAFTPVAASRHVHVTPGGAAQRFQTSVFRRTA
jgi:SAM-dependent methyltransferase